MNDLLINPVILTGGAGTRLWPVSRQSYPKQFQTLGGDQTLFQAALARAQGDGFAAPVVMTGEDFRFVVQDQLGDLPATILIEPQARDTAPAILAATLAVAQRDPQGLVLVLPADHRIPDVGKFQATVQRAKAAAVAGAIVTFGITPTRPETGYGYLELAAPPTGNGPVALVRFLEKPDAETAAEFLASGNYLWNAGLFLFRADTMLAAFKTHAPEMTHAVQAAFDGRQDDLGFARLAATPWAQAEKTSIDYAIMEKAHPLVVLPFAGDWSDLGSWEAILRDGAKDHNGVSLVGGAQELGTTDSLLYRDADGPAVMGLGLKDTIVVATKDAVLVADKAHSQDVKQAVDQLKATGAAVATQTPRVHRPWGWYETLALGGRFQVKRIVVKPGGILSLQSHLHRSEHWVVVEGTAKVTLDDTVQLVTENQSIYVPLGTKHRLENPGQLPMVLIEVQTGSYLGEDDITRHEDLYNRPAKG